MSASRSMARDGALLILAFVLTAAWFAGGVLSRGAIAALGLLLLAGLVAGRLRALWDLRPGRATVLVCGLGLLLRAPAFLEPAGVIGADGSLQAMQVPVILDEAPPAPVFIEGSSYQGSLKAHLGAVASLFLGREDLGLLVVASSAFLWTILTASVMAFGRRLGGREAAVVAGLFVALSPRFATIFSVSNVGEYPDAMGLGVLAMAWAARLVALGERGIAARRSFFGIGVLLGIALWQQPIAVSYGIVALGLLFLRAARDRDPWVLASAAGLFLGRLPVWIHGLQAVETNDRVVGSFLRSAGRSLSLSEHASGTIEWAFPIVFAGYSNDSTGGRTFRVAVGIACAALFLLFLGWTVRRGLEGRTGGLGSPERIMVCVQFLTALAFVWLVAGGGQYTRPRYFLPLLPSFALAFGDACAALWRRSGAAGLILATLVIGSNALSNVERLRAGVAEGDRLRRLAARIEEIGLKTGYASVAVAGPLTMLTSERVSVDGALETDVGQRLPARHVRRVAHEGPDFYLAEGPVADRLVARFEELGVSYRAEGGAERLFYGFSRRVTLAEVRADLNTGS